MNHNHITMKELPDSERPYEKCERKGVSFLSDTELLAVIIRTGTKTEDAVTLAHRIMNFSKYNKGLNGINYLSQKELMSIKGIGRVKAIQLKCITELSKRMARQSRSEGICLTSPTSVAEYYMQDMRHLTTEQILLIMIDSKSRILNDMIISSGTVNSSILAPREIYLNALKYDAVSIILVHNHPSGDPTPSAEDINTTERMKDAGNLIGIKLMDHIIIGDNRYISLKEKGLL